MIRANTNPSSDAKALLELESNSALNRALTTLIKTSFLEQRPLNWKPVKCELVVNSKLTDEFMRIKSEFQRSADQPCEFEENYAFLIETDAQVNNICQNGYCCQENVYNVLGQSKSGIYLCKYSDISLKYAENKKWPENLTLKMIIFKICYGKQTLAMVRKPSKLQPIGPTVGFHSHSSVIPPKELEDIETQFDHSQIYLYELNSEKVGAKRPRHCLPYAVVTWLKFTDGTEWPHNFNEQEGEISILHTDSIQVAMSTDDSYMKNKLKDILRVTEEAQLKNEVVINNIDSNNVINNSNSPINNNTSIITNGNGSNNEMENVPVIESIENIESDISKNMESQLTEGLNTEVQNTNTNGLLPNESTNGLINSTTSTTSTTTVTTPTTTVVSSSTVVVPTPTPVYHKSYNNFQKPIHSYAYRQASAAAMAPYILAQSPSPYGAIRIPYLSQTPTPTANPQYYAGAQYANLAAPALQQQFYLCRGPNGLTYVAAPQAHVLGASAAQAAYLQSAGAAATYAGAPAAYKLPVAALQQFAAAGPQTPQPQQQIIYQAAPQPSQSAAAAAATANKAAGMLTTANNIVSSNNIVVAGANVQQQNALQAAASQQQAIQAASQQQAVQQNQVHAPQTQSPKQNVSASNGQASNSQYSAAQYSPQNTTQVYATQNQINQINQMQQLQAAYQGQPTYLAYTPSANNISTTMGQAFYTNPSSYVLAQTGNGQQYANPAQAGIYGYTTQIPGTVSNGYATQQQASQISMTLPTGAQAPAGYQILNYGQVQGIAGSAAAVQLDQFGQATGIARPRLINVRHHPYQRN